MRLSDLTEYAEKKYSIREQHKWADFPSFSVLAAPDTGKWIALLMRQWDSQSGTEIQRCDLKCGSECLTGTPKPYLTAPTRMRGLNWVGITLDDSTEPEVVFRLFDKAVDPGDVNGYTLILASQLPAAESAYQETALPFSGSTYRPPEDPVPQQLRQMRRMFEYGTTSLESKISNFYHQASFMEDYEDDYPWKGDFICYFPTYHDMTTRQLRGYFSWRTRVRKGEYLPIPTSAAYIYIYELLNGIGGASPEDCLRKMKEFETGFIDSGIGSDRMRQNLHRWMLEYAVLQDLPPETARQYADPKQMEKDRALSVLREPAAHTDEEIFSALCLFGGKKTALSPVLTAEPERGIHLFSEIWRYGSARQLQKKDLFTQCFGKKTVRSWYPLANAIYFRQTKPADRDYILNECRAFHCRAGIWQCESYENLNFDRTRIQALIHEADAALRRYLKTGHYLREKKENSWALPVINAVIESDRRAQAEAARPKIVIDLSGLEQIRRDAITTRDSLLTEEEIDVPEIIEEIPQIPSVPEPSGSPLDPVLTAILRELLQGRDAADLLKAEHLMPSIAADTINEVLYDEIGDTVVDCENDRLFIIEDYREDIEHLLGG